MPNRQGSFRLFSYSGIDVFVHWSWFVAAVYEINFRSHAYSSVVWNVLEYLSVFLIVMMHEFGHSLACRQVGGSANQIVLWPLGGVAYVDPPPRPGATLWSIAAGPLVNVALIPVLFALSMVAQPSGASQTMPDAYRLIGNMLWMNLALLKFNLLPIYPLDGGQIFRSLLWFVVGRARSLMIASVIGVIGVVGMFAVALLNHSVWYGVIAAFILMTCWSGLQQARALSQLAKIPRRRGFACPWCKSEPPLGEFWKCAKCGASFDTFQTHGVCPNCSTQYPVTHCLDCRRAFPINEWMVSAVAPPKL
jgi:Zn-dependent protease